jgi:chemotaxis protein MotB
MKPSHEEEHENHERWLVSYADFITLLFAFFVVMYATSNSDLDKQKKFEESVQSSFGNKSKQPKAIAFSVEQKPSGNSVMELPNQINYNQDLIEIEDRLIKMLQNIIETKQVVKIKNEGKNISLEVNQSALFKNNEEAFNTQGLRHSIVIGQILKNLDVNIEILVKTNQELDFYLLKRGRMIQELFVNKLKINATQIALKFIIEPSSSVDSLSLSFNIYP